MLFLSILFSTDDEVCSPSKRLRIKMFVLALTLLFLIRLRFPRARSLTDTIFSRYGHHGVQVFRRYEKLLYSTKKLECDLKFLKTCKEYDKTPNFLIFKTHRPAFQHSRTYKSWLLKLLDRELNIQSTKLESIYVHLLSAEKKLRDLFSYFDFKCILSIVETNVEKRIVNVRNTHHRKLLKLGIDNLRKVDKDKVIFNLSDRVLTDKEKNILSLGLDFGLPNHKINYYDHFLLF